MSERYARSEAFLARAEKVIPLGSQTFSKSKTQYPFGVSPYFASHAQGCRLWDIDGNAYLDCVMGLAAFILGYGDPEVNTAVKAQLDKGSLFSLPATLETEVAERLCAMVPCAEMVRFGKNGSDATAGAIRLARAYTGRDHVAVCGYHGWQDWYIGSTARNKGVPQAVCELTHTFAYNDLASLDRLFDAYPGQIAAVILEPMNVSFPQPGFLEGVRERATRHGTVLVFDETITGFRFANGGAQEVFGVIPDLATFGKGLANGFPLSALVGHRALMREMEEIFFSFTFGGETLSLAAASATLDKLGKSPILAEIAARGERFKAALKALIERNGLAGCLSVSGHPSWIFLLVSDTEAASQWEIRTWLMQELFARGILWIGSHNLSAAHDEAALAALLDGYGEILPMLFRHLVKGTLSQVLRCEPLQPLFRVR
ncbi:aminotransferase class III-fold pyridoxal phosphate-dependent enzyme [Sulfuricystis multivorans]|uniref:aminotransferase class III-fold pyridoxal phosphate-dependent enzyme n=1 Tax=Sulfuricystis multivorans TaxID=2211108 RepID=UPI000F835B27|nr:aminotransferase class III-fold pyridoxal phosphate-dependent enzyme [Sulfuricystis multivorans]